MTRLTLALLAVSFCVLLATPSGAPLGPVSLSADRLSAQGAEVSALAEVTFQQGVSPDASYTGATDTYIDGENPATNNGPDGQFKLHYDGRRRILIQFDLSARIPSNAVVTSASLQLNVKSRTYTKTTSEMGAYEVLRPWNELQATWQRAATGFPWAESGCSRSVGLDSDRAAEYTAVATLNATNVWASWGNVPMAALVQKWVNNPAANHGLIIVGLAENLPQWWTLHSSQSLSPDLRPKLVVNYFVPTPSRTPTRTNTPTKSPTVTSMPTATQVYTQSHVAGQAWYDVDQDGVREAGEPLLADVTVLLKNEDYQEVGRTVTGAEGRYEFTELPAGNYIVSTQDPEGYVRSWPPDGGYAFYVSGVTHIAGLDFGFGLPPTRDSYSVRHPDCDGYGDPYRIAYGDCDPDGNTVRHANVDAHEYPDTDCIPFAHATTGWNLLRSSSGELRRVL